MVEPCLRMFSFLKKTFLHFLCSMVCRYAWIQGFHYANICVITGVTFSGMREMILWWLNTLIINFFEPMFVWVWLWTPSCFVHFLSHHFVQTYSFIGLLFTFIIFCQLCLCFLNFAFSPKYWKYVTVSGVSYCTWNSPSVIFLANIHNYTINKDWRQKTTLFRIQKEIIATKKAT